MENIYGFYTGLFIRDQKRMLWAGMAKLAGAAVWKGLTDIIYGRMLAPGYGAGSVLETLEKQLVIMNREIFMDLGWQHAAFSAKGIAEMKTRLDAGEIDKNTFNAWNQISKGDATSIAAGNKALLRREQEFVLARGYKAIEKLGRNAVMDYLSASPIPGSRDFWTVVPRGDLTKFKDRWKWIETDMLPAWIKLKPTLKEDLVSLPIEDLVKKLFG